MIENDYDQAEAHAFLRESGPTSEAEFEAIERRALARELNAAAKAAQQRLDHCLSEQRRIDIRELNAALLDIYRSGIPQVSRE